MKRLILAAVLSVLCLSSSPSKAGEDFPFVCYLKDLEIDRFTLHQCRNCTGYYVTVYTNVFASFQMKVDVTLDNDELVIYGSESIPLKLISRFLGARIALDDLENSKGRFVTTTLGLDPDVRNNLRDAECELDTDR